MATVYNVYCDESCHLEHDNQRAMVLGAVWFPEMHARKINRHVRNIKMKHGFGDDYELKWTKVSRRNIGLYLDIVRFFFSKPSIRFRAVIIPNKEELNHGLFNQTHDDWYYKMYFTMIRNILNTERRFNIYLDQKDTCSQKKIERLHQYLCNSIYDFDCSIVQKIQAVQSHEINALQMADVLIGALSYYHRGLAGNEAKNTLVHEVAILSGCNLSRSTLPSISKFNIFVWKATTVTCMDDLL